MRSLVEGAGVGRSNPNAKPDPSALRPPSGQLPKPRRAGLRGWVTWAVRHADQIRRGSGSISATSYGSVLCAMSPPALLAAIRSKELPTRPSGIEGVMESAVLIVSSKKRVRAFRGSSSMSGPVSAYRAVLETSDSSAARRRITRPSLPRERSARRHRHPYGAHRAC